MAGLFLVAVYLIPLAYATAIPRSNTTGSNIPESVTNAIFGTNDETEKLRQELIQERIDRVVALIQPTSYGDAEVAFNQLHNMSFVRPIMASLYGDPYQESLYGFTKILHSLSERMIAYQTWIELLENKGHLLTGGILVFRKAVTDDVSNAGSLPPQELIDLHKRLEIYTNARLGIWAREISKGVYTPVTDFGSPVTYHMIGKIFQESLPELVKLAFGNGETERLLKLLEFVKGLRWNMHKYVGLKEVYNLVTDDRRLVVALKIKETLEGCLNGPDPANLAEQLLIGLKESLPLNVQHLLWHEQCSLKNKQEGEYLYADSLTFDPNNQRIFTWIPNIKPPGTALLLVPTLNSTGDGLVFGIESRFVTDYKYLDGHTSGAGDGLAKKHVSLRKNKPGLNNWRVELSALNSEVMLYHLTLKGYLMADFIPYDLERRQVVVWVHELLAPTTNVWTLECVPI